MNDQPTLHSILSEFFDNVDKAFICANSAIETVAILGTALPWKSKLKLIYVHSDSQLPEIVSTCRGLAKDYELIELQAGDYLAHWGEFGIASALTPVAGDGLLQPWTSCCAALRQKPVIEFLRGQGGRTGFINAQRYAGQLGDVPARGRLSEAVVSCLPFWGVPDDQFSEWVEAEKWVRPFPVLMAPDGLDCGACAARMTPARMAYLATYYPALAEEVGITAEITIDALGSELQLLGKLRDGPKRLRATEVAVRMTEGTEHG